MRYCNISNQAFEKRYKYIETEEQREHEGISKKLTTTLKSINFEGMFHTTLM